MQPPADMVRMWLQGTTTCGISLPTFAVRTCLSVRVEVGYGLARDHVNSRPADVLVQGWDKGKPAAFDVVSCRFTPYTSNLE